MPTIEINTNVGCKLACTFCPQDKLVKSYNKKINLSLIFTGSFLNSRNRIS